MTANQKYLKIAKDQDASAKVLDFLVRETLDIEIFRIIAEHPNTTETTLEFIFKKSDDSDVLNALAANKNTPIPILVTLAESDYWEAFYNPNMPLETLEAFAEKNHNCAMSALAKHPNTSFETLEMLAKKGNDHAILALMEDPRTTLNLLESIIKKHHYGYSYSPLASFLAKSNDVSVETLMFLTKNSINHFEILISIANNKNATPEILDLLTFNRNGDRYKGGKLCLAIASNTNTSQETLRYLASSTDVKVVSAALNNRNAPYDFFKTFNFKDGMGTVSSHRHINPDGSLGGLVADTAFIEETVTIEHSASVFGHAVVMDNAVIADRAKVFGEAFICDNVHVFGDAKIYGDAFLFGNLHIDQNVDLLKKLNIEYESFDSSVLSENAFDDNYDFMDHGDVPVISRQPTGFKIPPPPEPLQFNTERISEIKTESKKVSAMLNTIYEQDETTPVAEKSEPQSTQSVLNLDETHLEIVKILATKPEWERNELQKIMKGMMIDGVLEHINDAFFDYCDKAFIEGDDPIEINVELYKEIFK